MKGLEPPRLAAPDPKSGASTNSATSALKNICKIINFFDNVKINLLILKFSNINDKVTSCKSEVVVLVSFTAVGKEQHTCAFLIAQAYCYELVFYSILNEVDCNFPFSKIKYLLNL